MKVRDTLGKGIHNYYFKDGGEPIRDITPHLDEDGEIETYEDWDGDGDERITIKWDNFILGKTSDEIKIETHDTLEKILGVSPAVILSVLRNGFFGTPYGEPLKEDNRICHFDNIFDFSIVITNSGHGSFISQPIDDYIRIRYDMSDYGKSWALAEGGIER